MIFDFVPLHTVIHETVEMEPRHTVDADYGEKSDIDWDYYTQASLAGGCFASTVRDQKLVGYSVYFVSTQVNHKHILEANNSVLFIEKKYRGKVLFKLLQTAEIALVKMGVKEINYLIKNERLGNLLKRRGFKATHTQWSIKV